ncbi:glycosyltransferase [Candidatus Daviesbacteria bacterium]|nr:glycosyltransferase [Candidatus Daviesbacteria bacterium]
MVKKKINNQHNRINIFALAATGLGISGGDRIFIEFARRWNKEMPVEIYVSEEGYQMCLRQNLKESKDLRFTIYDLRTWNKLGFIANYVVRILTGIKIGLTLKLENSQNSIIYSASEFWMDSLPAFLLKLRFPKIKWAAAWYQTAPNPFKGFSEGEAGTRDRLRALIYWLIQLPIKPLISGFADYVLVNNDGEKKQFPNLDKRGRALVVLGAVDLEGIKSWKLKFRNLPKIYEAVFQGRFHPQKGVMELIDIWKHVAAKKPDAKLVMIGDGPLMENVKLQITNYKLNKNIILKGYMFDGEEKFKIFAQSRIVVHPAFFDSGGMASAEAMAFGLPCVGFNLGAYKYYYPKGMEKVREGDIKAFADKVAEFLQDNNLYRKVANKALHLIGDKWSWEYRARQILNAVLE